MTETIKDKIILDMYSVQDEIMDIIKKVKEYKEEIDYSLKIDNKGNRWEDADEVETHLNKMTEKLEDCINMIDFSHDDEE